MEEKDKSLFKYNGKTYKLIKQPGTSDSCKDFCSLDHPGCENLCVKAYNKLDNPNFGLIDAVFVEVDESGNKETGMKENEIDYKALYEETISKLKIAKKNVGCYTFSSVIDKVLPELKESEDDKIRKALIKYLEALDDEEIRYGVSFKEMRFWLEKQGEQKHTNKVEPKFKVGDWITDNTSTFQIVRVENEWYYADDGDKICFDVAHQYYHLWTIQDAKDGDVLVASDGSIFLLKGVIDGACKHYVALTIDNVLAFNEGLEHYWETSTSVHPATHEQYNLLFSKMKEAGYEWDAEKKEIRKIEQKPSTSVTEFDAEVERFCKECFITDADEKGKVFCIARHFADWQKNRKNSAWSEEDEKVMYEIEVILANTDLSKFTLNYKFSDILNWLNSLKERMQPKQELNEEVVNECVDLGLPSGTLWKPFNEEGYYTYDEAVNKFNNQLPSKEQWEELKEKCKWKWKGNGYDIIGPNGHIIYLHAEGCRNGTEVYGVGMYGVYWSNTYYDEKYATANSGYRFDNNDIGVYDYDHDYGLSVRLVK